MKFKHQNLFVISLLSLGLVLPSLGNTFSSKEEKNVETGPVLISEKYEKGPVFYPASYSTSFTDEPRYNSYQKELTYNYLNMGNVSDNYRGDSVKVAVIDSGINYTHEDFQRSGQTVVKGNSRSIEYTTVDDTPGWYYFNFSQSPTHLNDTLFHGTAVASVIASVLNGVGGAGLAPNVELYVYKVTNTNNAYEWTAINNALQYCINEGIDVINMSFQAYVNSVSYGGSTQAGSGNGVKTVLSSKLNACHNAGITLVAAAGNYNTTEPSYPAHNNHVISVGSLDRKSSNTKAGFSNYGADNIDLVAPGYVNVATKGGNSAYIETQGTSFSAPIVTAAIALYKQKYPDATPDDIKVALLASCDEIAGASSWAGAGRLNVANFLDATPYDETGVSLDKSTATIDIGALTKTVQLNATVQDGEFYPNVTWSSSNTSVATVSSSGLVTGKTVGTATITARTTHNYTATCTVTVTQTEILPTSIIYSGPTEICLAVGDTYPISCEVLPANTTNKAVGFDLECEPAGTISIDSNGLITAVKEGYACFQIYSLADPELYCPSTIEVFVENGSSQSIAPRNGTYSLLTDVSKLVPGVRVIFTSGKGSGSAMNKEQASNNRTGVSVTFDSSNIIVSDTKNTSVGTFIVETGKVAGSIAFKDENYSSGSGGYLYAASSSDNYLRTQTTLNNNGSFIVSLNSSQQATITGQGNNSRKIIRWNSSSSIFSCYASGQNPPYIYYQETPIYPTTTVISGETTATTGDTVPLSISYQPSTATVKETTWSSSNTTLATVNASGVVTTKAAGTVTITATSKSGASTTITSTHTITISDISVTGVSLNESTMSLTDGSSATLIATVLPDNATNKNVTWSTSNASVATVTNGVVTATGAGDVTITVTTVDGSFTDYCLITVSERPSLESIEVTGYATSVPYMNEYDAGSYTCIAHFVNGYSEEVEATITQNIDTSVLGPQILEFSYTEKEITKTFEGSVKVTNVGAESNVGVDVPEKEEKATVTASFTNKDWGTSGNTWTGGISGGGYDNSKGVQITKAATGAGATSKSTYTNVSKISVVYSTSSGGVGSFAVKVGTNAAQSFTVSKSQTNQTKNFTVSPYQSGTVNLTVTCSSSSIYIKSITIETVAIVPGETFPASPEDQAIAWAKYFREVTYPYCLATEGGAMEGDVWNDLKAEYEAMTDDSKDAFFESSDADVVDARARYAILIANYSNLTNFILDSNDNKLVNKNNNPIIGFISESTNWLVIILSISVVGVVGTFLLIRRRKHD